MPYSELEHVSRSQSHPQGLNMSREVAGGGGGGQGERSGLRITCRSTMLLGEIEVDGENVNCDDPFPLCAHFQPSVYYKA